MQIELPLGRETWRLEVRPEVLVGKSPQPFGSPASTRQMMREALNQPAGVDFPVHRAFTPDDRVAVVLDSKLPQLGELIAGLLDHLEDAGIPSSAVTLVCPPDTPDEWVDELPDELAELVIENHNPADENKHAYLATTRAGRRVYLNRTVVESEAVIVLGLQGYKATGEHLVVQEALFPNLSNDETRSGISPKSNGQAPPVKPLPIPKEESAEIAWLLGTPIFVHVIAGSDNQIAEIVVTLGPGQGEAEIRQDSHWRQSISQTADLVIATVTGSPGKTRFTNIANAAATAARVLASDGRLLILTEAAPELPEAMEIFRQELSPDEALETLKKYQSAIETTELEQWAEAARTASLFIASGWPDELTEELYATPIHSQSEAQRLVDAATRVLVLPDADKCYLDVE